MTNVRKIHVDWYGQQPPRFHGGPQLAYQGDHLSNMVVFDNAPELPNYYLIVKMKTDDSGPVDTLPAIMLEGPYWVIPNYYTQICQQITYQVCCKTGTGDYEHHSAEFKGTILPVLKHDGDPIDQSPMFDPYIDILDKRVDELIVAAGDIQIDSELKSDSGNPVQNKVVKAAIDEVGENVGEINGRLQRQQGIIAEAFSAQSTYNVGDSVIYEAGLYTFRANKVAGAWDATKVDGPFKVTNELSSLKSDLTAKIDVTNDRSYMGTVERGKWRNSDGNLSDNSNALCLTVIVEPNTVYYVSGTAVNVTFPLIVYFDEENNVIGTEETTGNLTPYTDYKIVTPLNCNKLSVNGRVVNTFGAAYPALYTLVNNVVTGNDIQSLIDDKQKKSLKWTRAEYVHETNKYVLIRNYRAEISDSNAGGYRYAKLTYDKTKRYRFYAVCRANIIPCVLCCDSNDQIIKVYDATAETIIKAKEYSDIPENTEYIYVNSYRPSDAVIEVASERNTESFESDKIGVFFGDSITQGANVYQYETTPYQDYPSVVERLLGCTVYNGGLGGGTFAGGRSIDFKNVVDCIVSGDFSTVISGITEYGLNNTAIQQYEAISALDFSKVDFVSIAFGTNDWISGKSLATVKTAMSYCLEKLMTNFPNLRIYVFTPIYRFNINSSGEDADVYINPTSNITLHDMCEGIMECAASFNVPCKDMFYNCNINSYNKSLYMGDDTHPNANGYSLMGDKVAKFINAN